MKIKNKLKRGVFTRLSTAKPRPLCPYYLSHSPSRFSSSLNTQTPETLSSLAERERGVCGRLVVAGSDGGYGAVSGWYWCFGRNRNPIEPCSRERESSGGWPNECLSLVGSGSPGWTVAGYRKEEVRTEAEEAEPGSG